MSGLEISDKPIHWPANIPYDRQAFAVRGTKKPGQTAHYRNAIWGLVDENTPGAYTTLDTIFEDGLKVSQIRGGSQEFLGRRPKVNGQLANHFEWITYPEADVRRRNIGSAVHKLFRDGTLVGDEGRDGEVYETVGIWASNRPEWQIADLALQAYAKVGVSLYDTLGKDSVEYIINHSSLSIVFASAEHVPDLLKLAPKTPCLKYIVCFDTVPAEAATAMKDWGTSVGKVVISLAELEEFGRANPCAPIPATPEAVATICYTSGTTNVPKGVVLLHKTLAMTVTGYCYGREVPDNSILFSYMPLAHIYQRMAELVAIATGCRVGYFSGDPLRLLEDAQILKPHYFPSVPRVLNRIYQGAMAAGEAPGLKGALFRKALAVKLANLEASNGKVYTHAFWDKLVFKKVQAVLGGQVLFVGSGSAPITPAVLNFLRVALAADVTEGYGLTESSAIGSRTLKDDPTGAGTVGPPAVTNEVKLIDVAEMGYTAEDQPFPRGELCLRGATVFSHYHKNPAATADALDADGWFRTGDVAAIDAAGRVKIIDRVKNIMKLAQGEYVALEKVENVYTSVPVVAQMFVHGDGTQSYCVGVVVPEAVAFSALVSAVWGRKVAFNFNALGGGGSVTPEAEEAVRDPAVVQKVLDLLNQEGNAAGLKGFEQIKRLHLSLSPFSVDDGTLTPTMKLRRKDASNKYRAEIDAMYALGEPNRKNGAGSVSL